MNKLMETQRKIEKGVVAGYKAIENGVVVVYKAIENGIVSGYKKIEDSFVKAFLSDATEEPHGNGNVEGGSHNG